MIANFWVAIIHGHGQIHGPSAGQKIGSTTNPVREEQILDFAANRTIWVPHPSPLTAMKTGQLGLDRLRNPLLTAAFRQIP
jgi:hypothetical protein